MKKRIIVCLISFLLCSSAGFAQENAKKTPAFKNDTLRVIHNRKSVRHYLTIPVSKEDLDILLRAGMAAPTAADKRPWAFIAITDKEKLTAIASGFPYGRMLAKAGVAIIVCGIPEKSMSGEAQGFWVQDCSAATENILLAAESLGLGAVWIGVYPLRERVIFLSSLLGIPEEVVPLSIISIGYPTGAEKPKNKYNPANIHWNKW